MSPQLQIVVAVYFVPFLALMLAALGMEVYERVSEWLDHRRRKRILAELAALSQEMGWYDGPNALTLDDVIRRDPPTPEDPPEDASSPRDDSAE